MIECEICHKKFKRIQHLHLKLHDITYDKYIEIYPNAKLISDESSIRTSISAMGNKSRTGQKSSEETKEKQSISHMGEKNVFYGKRHTEEVKEIIRKSMKGKYCGDKNPAKRPEVREKISNSLKGKLKSEEHKQKMRDNHYDCSGINNSNYGKPAARLAGIGKRSYYNSPLQGEVCFRSSYELAYAKYLDIIKILWIYEEFRFKLSNGITYCPDFYLPNENKFIEIKGYLDDRSKIRITKFLDEYPEETLQILYKEDLIKLGCDLK